MSSILTNIMRFNLFMRALGLIKRVKRLRKPSAKKKKKSMRLNIGGASTQSAGTGTRLYPIYLDMYSIYNSNLFTSCLQSSLTLSHSEWTIIVLMITYYSLFHRLSLAECTTNVPITWACMTGTLAGRITKLAKL